MNDSDQHTKLDAASTSQIWGGRFNSGPDQVMDAINPSIDFDRRFSEQDIAGSRAHAAMLVAAGIISARMAPPSIKAWPKSPMRSPPALSPSRANWKTST